MPLVPIWKQQSQQVLACSIQQVLAMAGDGKLLDGSLCSQELRHFLSEAPVPYLISAARFCLENAFTDSGLVLQDIINEIGSRLEFKVERGPYRGSKNKTGFDGIWKAPGCRDMVIEVKTTDYINLPLRKLFDYKNALLKSGKISADACALIILGREDAGSLADQVRGSRFAADARLISVNALVSLLRVIELADQTATVAKMRALLQPIETVKLDDIINIVFSTALDVEDAVQSESGVATGSPSDELVSKQHRTPNEQIDAKREQATASLAKRLGLQFVKHRRTVFKSTEGNVRLCVVVSNKLASATGKNPQSYWYVYHPDWDTFLKQGSSAYLVLSCMDQNVAFAIPYSDFAPLIVSVNGRTTSIDAYLT
jgi:hypothetical protein